MGMQFGGKRGIVANPNVVPLIDILLVLLVIFMMIPAHYWGEDALIPQPPPEKTLDPRPDEIVVVQVLADGSLRINREAVEWDKLSGRLEEAFKLRARRIAFVRGDRPVEFGVVARAIDVMHTAGIASVGLLTPDVDRGL